MVAGGEMVPGHIPHCNIDLRFSMLSVLYPRRDVAVTDPSTFPQRLRHLFISREVENCSGVVWASPVILVIQAPWL